MIRLITLTENEFRKLTTYIKTNYGINLIEKKTLIEGRLNNLLIEKGFHNYSDYMEYVLSDLSGNEISSLINKLTTNHTFFMREVSHFDYFKNVVLPYLKNNCKDNDLRIWSAGCSSGEEPYTLSMIISDFFGNDKMYWNTKILATDISLRALDIARNGIYPGEDVENLPSYWKLNYFSKIDHENYEISHEIKNEVIFRTFNLMDARFPFKKKFHVIFCRNVMIYFDEKTKMELINKFYDITEPGGYLFIGHSESINKGESKYNYVMPAVYRKG